MEFYWRSFKYFLHYDVVVLHNLQVEIWLYFNSLYFFYNRITFYFEIGDVLMCILVVNKGCRERGSQKTKSIQLSCIIFHSHYDQVRYLAVCAGHESMEEKCGSKDTCHSLVIFIRLVLVYFHTTSACVTYTTRKVHHSKSIYLKAQYYVGKPSFCFF